MQILITSKDELDFDAKVNSLLKDGWKVVPGTGCISTTGYFNSSDYVEVYMITVEKD